MDLEVVEAADSVERIADEEKRPALPDRLQRTRHRTVLAGVVLSEHSPHCSLSLVIELKLCYGARLVSSIIELEEEMPLPGWVRAGAALFGAAWGSNQFTPMLLVYRQRLGLQT